jgi:hypothetical protein
MENTKKSLSDSILELVKSTPNVSESVSDVASKSVGNVATETGSGIFGFISSISWITWLVIVLILAFLGFNIFYYLAEGTQGISNIFGPIFKNIVGLIYETADQTIDVAAEGGKAATTATASGINKGLTVVQDVTPNKMKSSVSSTNYEDKEEIEESKNSLNKALNNSNKNNRNNGKDDEYEPNQASSSVHETGKAGWCFIGEDRGYRTCSKVGKDDKCMSGDIFPTQQLCINPNLRA